MGVRMDKNSWLWIIFIAGVFFMGYLIRAKDDAVNKGIVEAETQKCMRIKHRSYSWCKEYVIDALNADSEISDSTYDLDSTPQYR